MVYESALNSFGSRLSRKAVFGDWLYGQEWDSWHTYTFEPCKETTEQKLPKHKDVATSPWAKDQFLKSVIAILPELATYIWVSEWNRFGDCPVFHALVGNSVGFKFRWVQRQWYREHGFAKVVKYNPKVGKGACLYVAEHILFKNGDWDVSPSFKKIGSFGEERER